MFVGAGGNFDFNVPPCWALSPLSNQWCCSGGQTKLCYTACSADLTAPPPQPPVHVGPQGSKTTWCRKKLKGGQLSWMALHTKHQGSRKREIKTWLKEWNVFVFFEPASWSHILFQHVLNLCLSLNAFWSSLFNSPEIWMNQICVNMLPRLSGFMFYSYIFECFFPLCFFCFFPISFSIIIPPEREPGGLDSCSENILANCAALHRTSRSSVTLTCNYFLVDQFIHV